MYIYTLPHFYYCHSLFSKMSSSLNPNAPIYNPYLPLSTPMAFYNSSPLHHPFYCQYLHTPSHTSFLYVSSPPFPELLTYYYPPTHQSLYSCCSYTENLFPFATIPETSQPHQEAKGKSILSSDHDQVGQNLDKGVVVKRSFFGRKKVFAPKLSMHKRRVSTTPTAAAATALENFEFKNGDLGGGKTTVMIKNLPNKFTKGKLLSILDQHCYEENQKVEGSADGSEFNFFYLPIDFRSGSNLGYAFVNFTSAAAAWRLHRSLHQYEWKLHGSRKMCEVTYARIQGLGALLKHFKSSVFACNDLEFLPVYFDPPRNGCRATKQQYVGKHTPISTPL